MTKYKYTGIGDNEIIFRTISLEEAGRFSNGLNVTDDPYAEEYIFDIITDHQYDIDSLDAGIIPIIIFLSLSLSGLFKEEIDIPNKIDDIRKDLDGNPYYLMYSVIAKAQPSYTLDQLKLKTANEILELFAFSELVLGHKQIDTDKARESIAPKTTVAKGIKGITKEEILGLQEALSGFEFEGTLQDEFRL